jgi:hypothetical protein
LHHFQEEARHAESIKWILVLGLRKVLAPPLSSIDKLLDRISMSLMNRSRSITDFNLAELSYRACLSCLTSEFGFQAHQLKFLSE